MSTIINIANELQALQGRITADKASLQEARAIMEREHNDQLAEWLGEYEDRRGRAIDRHKRLMAFIDGQIAAKDEAIEGDAVAVVFREAAE